MSVISASSSSIVSRGTDPDGGSGAERSATRALAGGLGALTERALHTAAPTAAATIKQPSSQALVSTPLFVHQCVRGSPSIRRARTSTRLAQGDRRRCRRASSFRRSGAAGESANRAGVHRSSVSGPALAARQPCRTRPGPHVPGPNQRAIDAAVRLGHQRSRVQGRRVTRPSWRKRASFVQELDFRSAASG